MKGYIIVSFGDDSDTDYICASDYGDTMRKVFFSKKTAQKFRKKLQKDFDDDRPDNSYHFILQEVKIVTD